MAAAATHRPAGISRAVADFVTKPARKQSRPGMPRDGKTKTVFLLFMAVDIENSDISHDLAVSFHELKGLL